MVTAWNIGKFYCPIFLHSYNDQRTLRPWIAPVLKSVEWWSAIPCRRSILCSDGLQTCTKPERGQRGNWSRFRRRHNWCSCQWSELINIGQSMRIILKFCITSYNTTYEKKRNKHKERER